MVSSSTELPSFSYDPLLEPKGIRLLLVNPGLEDEPLRGKMLHTSIDDCRPYHALSYAWEGDVRCKEMEVNSMSLPVTASIVHQEAIRGNR